MDNERAGERPSEGLRVEVATESPPSRERVLEAAARVFAADGLDAPMPAVAAAAGVGVGTIYRAFGSKEELIAALSADRVEIFARDAEAALERSGDNAWRALVDLFELTAERQAEDYIVTEAFAANTDHPKVMAAQERAAGPIQELFARAKQQGGLRSDFETPDLQMFFAALGAAQTSMPRGSRAWKRLLAILIDGLRPEGASELTEPPLTPDDIVRAASERRARRGG
jgi:AcrR family transcriptional regulator